MTAKQKAGAGFTLIELLVVASIMIVMVGGGVVAFANLRDKQKVLADVKAVEGQLRTAQRRSLAGEKPEPCGGFELTGYRVALEADRVRLAAVCPGAAPAEVESVLTSSVISADVAEVEFRSVAGGATAAVVDICQNGGGSLYRIVVGPTGVIIGPTRVAGGC